MDILIDSMNLKTNYGISVIDYTSALGFAAERVNERVWADKSGVDKNLQNVRYDAKEFVLNCVCKAANEVEAYNQINNLVTYYMFRKGCFVLSLRDPARGIRKAFLCERSNTIVGSINIREQNSLYYFKLGLKDVNPNALTYYITLLGGSSIGSIVYDKGQQAIIYWGNGHQAEVSNSGTYQNTYHPSAITEYDVIIDIDWDAEVVQYLEAGFTATPTTEHKPGTIQFTDSSLGGPTIWSWDFGDGGTSSEQNPSHTYTQSGVYTVVLQVFNEAGGSDIRTRTDYITIEDSVILSNSTDIILINDSGDGILLN